MRLKEVMKDMIIKAFDLVPATGNTITITEAHTHGASVLENRIWYRGRAQELEQYYKQTAVDNVSKSRFWAAVPSANSSIRKAHTGLPGMIVDKLTDIVIPDLDSIKLENNAEQERWSEIAKDNEFVDKVLAEAVKNTLIDGDGAFKISIDKTLTSKPIIEYYSGTDIEFNIVRGRIKEVIFIAHYTHKKKTYRLEEKYGRGYIKYELANKDGELVPVTSIPQTQDLEDIAFNGDFIMAIPMMFFRSDTFNGRGETIYRRKTDDFDALDEVLSQWVDAIRDGRVKTYIPEDLVPKDPRTGESITPNSFDNKFIKVETSLKEESKDVISQLQADINFDAFTETYANILDMCLQGVISPATLGIDLKKTDNATAQREKEKATLYTRGKMVKTLTEIIPALVNAVLKTEDLDSNKAPGEYDVTVAFGEYASPDFGSRVETVGQAKAMGVMSTEQAIEELYGDRWTEEEKAIEVQRIKQGGYVFDEQAAGIDGVDNFQKDEDKEEEEAEDAEENKEDDQPDGGGVDG